MAGPEGTPEGAAAADPFAITPVPTDEEASAITAAVYQAWPRPALPDAADTDSAPAPWRFSGRWWGKGRGRGR